MYKVCEKINKLYRFSSDTKRTNITLVQQISASSRCSYKTFGLMSIKTDTELSNIFITNLKHFDSIVLILSLLCQLAADAVGASKTISSAYANSPVKKSTNVNSQHLPLPT